MPTVCDLLILEDNPPLRMVFAETVGNLSTAVGFQASVAE